MSTIFGLDLGKFKSVACTYDPKTQEARHENNARDPATVRRFLDRLRPDLVVFES